MIKFNGKFFISICINFIFIAMAIAYAYGKDLEQTNRRGDSAIFEQLIVNIHIGESAYSNVFANTQNYIENYAGMVPAKLIAQGTLQGPNAQERNMLKFHAYYILYPLSCLVTFFKASLALGIVQSLCYFSLLLAAYSFIYQRTNSVISSVMFCMVVALNPNWYGGLQGWFYPDKIFILACFLFCWTLYANKKISIFLLTVGLLIIINERASLVGGIIIIFFIFPSSLNQIKVYLLKYKRIVILMITTIILLAYAYVQKNYILDNNYYGGHYLPTSFTELTMRFNNVQFMKNMGLNLLNNAPLLFLSLFAPRYALASLTILSLNLFGNIGGAEKIGWTTHYHSYYFPLLVFSAMLGFKNIILKLESLGIKQKIIVYIFFGGFISVLYLSQDYYKINALGLRPLVTFQSAFSQIENNLQGNPTGYTLRQKIQSYLLKNSTVATTELGMALLYDYSKVSFFPIDIMKADYVFIPNTDLAIPLIYHDTHIILSQWLILNGFDLSRIVHFPSLEYSLIPKERIKFLTEDQGAIQ